MPCEASQRFPYETHRVEDHCCLGEYGEVNQVGFPFPSLLTWDAEIWDASILVRLLHLQQLNAQIELFALNLEP